MDIKELRIGNLIERNGVVAKIELINNEIDEVYFIGEDFYYNDFCCNINPIPLTEEWLEKFGFERLSYERNFPLFISKNKDGYSHSFFVSMHSDFSRVSVVNQSLRTLKYVHQLQNLYFALTGEELTIKN